MNLWQRFQRTTGQPESAGLSLHFDKGIEPELRKKYVRLAAFLRSHYCFPIHVHVYIKNSETILLRSGKRAYGNFRWFPKRTPYISIPSKIENNLLKDYTIDEIYEQILSSLIHELTHYYQWVLNLDQSNPVSERQANYYRYRILDEAEEWYISSKK